jgi:hypothetical protein
MSGSSDGWIPIEGVFPPTVPLFLAAVIVVMIDSVVAVLFDDLPVLGHSVPAALSILFVGASTTVVVLSLRVLGLTQVRVSPTRVRVAAGFG